VDEPTSFDRASGDFVDEPTSFDRASGDFVDEPASFDRASGSLVDEAGAEVGLGLMSDMSPWRVLTLLVSIALTACNSSSGSSDSCAYASPTGSAQCCSPQTSTCHICSLYAAGQCTEVIPAGPCACPGSTTCTVTSIFDAGAGDAGGDAEAGPPIPLAVCQ
jgi:hypothetical protein